MKGCFIMNYIERENLSWEEAAICSEYAEKVIGYCREKGIDLSGPSAAECRIMEFDREVLNFNEWCACDLDDYIGDIIVAIGMAVEAY